MNGKNIVGILTRLRSFLLTNKMKNIQRGISSEEVEETLVKGSEGGILSPRTVVLMSVSNIRWSVSTVRIH